MKIISQVTITPHEVTVNGKLLPSTESGAMLLREIYKQHLASYPKFFKMDTLCRLGYVASELLLQHETPRRRDCDDRAVILFNTSGSLANDVDYQRTIQDADNCFPSPAVFVYTLPNIVTGEIAIANKYYGETAFYLLPNCDQEVMRNTVECTFAADATLTSAICGWLECRSADDFEAHLMLVEKGKPLP